jgi:diguanylate cyclase (GGDEF)-like protein/PAS domain S-box-containing protein
MAGSRTDDPHAFQDADVVPLRQVLEDVEEGYYEADLEGRLTFANRGLATILDRPRGELNGLDPRAFTDEATAQRLQGAFSRVRGNGEPAQVRDFAVRRPDGTLRQVTASVWLVRGEDGTPLGFRGLATDETDQRRAERLQSAARQLAGLAMADQDTPSFYRALHDVVGQVVEARNLQVALGGAEGLHYPYFADQREDSPSPGRPCRALAEHVLRTGAPLLVTPGAFASLVERGEFDAAPAPVNWVGVPLPPGGAAFGVLGVESHDPARGYTEPDRDALAFLSAYVAAAVARQRAAGAQRESESRFRALAETAPFAVFIEQAGRLHYANPAAIAQSGYTLDELRRMSFYDLLHPDGREATRAKGLSRHEAQVLTKSGAERWLDFSGAPVELDGRPADLLTAVDVTERRRADERMRTLAYHDPLTGLPNRLLFTDRLQLAVAQAHRQRERLAVLFVDLDGFKLINDSLGHAAGDRVLERTAERLVSSVREGDSVSRLGGDEFTLILPGLHRPEEIALVAEKVLQAIRRPLRLDGRELFVTASMGVSVYPDDGEDAATLVKSADTAMYRAKEQGRDQCQLYTPAMNVSAVERLAEENALRRALARNQIAALFRPQVDLQSGRLLIEALVEWPAPAAAREGGWKTPAELAGFMVPLVPWLVRTACAQARSWRAQGLTEVGVAVRISARQFRQPDLILEVQQALAEAGIDPHALELDVADTSALPHAHASAAGLAELRGLGVRLSIDDFAIGDASLDALRRLPMDAWKIDRALVNRLPGRREDADVVTALIALAHALRLEVVAEGVSGEAQREFLASRGCNRLRTDLAPRPLSAEDCGRLLLANPAFART